ncbi:hypothetical protein CRYPA_301 [uncultured Candidatus Thioglobus sp.]|nr:hypothetical protein CRYPA_301 [uncultured Candidatus Thioglobus sp.]
MYDRGKAYYYGEGVEQNYDKAFSAFSHAVKSNNADAQTALGVMYIKGRGVERDD